MRVPALDDCYKHLLRVSDWLIVLFASVVIGQSGNRSVPTKESGALQVR